MAVRIYLRRSKNDQDKQQFSLDVQRNGAERFASERFSELDVEYYVDDGKGGDEFINRPGLKKVLEDCRAGDIVIARDQSRLGRDALEVSFVIRELVQYKKCRLFYYVTQQEVPFSNAIEQATTYIQGVGHQLELEAIRSRTKEALRAKVRAGRVAGGRCYGYRLLRQTDASGRQYTIAEVEEKQAEVVRTIYAEYLLGRGLKAIAKSLNDAAIPCPTVGRRGTGVWAPSGIRSMLLNPRYRGLYVHGRIKKVQRHGRRVQVKADPSEIITLEMPEWRIVDEETWLAVQREFEIRRRGATENGTPLPDHRARYMLTGIGRCATCGYAIGVMRKRRRWEYIKAYGCTRHHQSGTVACPVSVHQPMDQVDDALLGYLDSLLDVPDMKTQLMSEVDKLLRARLGAATDTKELRAELRAARAAVKRLTRLGMLAGEEAVPAVAADLKIQNERVESLKLALKAARRTPDERASVAVEVERRVADRLAAGSLQLGGVPPRVRREVFEALFPRGLTFVPVANPKRWIVVPAGVARTTERTAAS